MPLQAARFFDSKVQVYRFNSGGAIGGSRMEKLNESRNMDVFARACTK